MLLQEAPFHFLWLNNIPLYIYHMFVYSSVHGHLSCFHFLAIVTSVVVNTGVHVLRLSFKNTHTSLMELDQRKKTTDLPSAFRVWQGYPFQPHAQARILAIARKQRPDWDGNWPRPKQVIPKHKNSDPVLTVCSLQPTSSVPWPWRSHCVREADRPVTGPGEESKNHREEWGPGPLTLLPLQRPPPVPVMGLRRGGVQTAPAREPEQALILSRSTSQTEGGSWGLLELTPRWVCFALHLFF